MSGGYLSGRYLSGGYLSGGICPAGICPDTIGRCWVWGIGSRIDFPHMFPMLVEAKMRSGLYPFFHLALVNDFGSLAS